MAINTSFTLVDAYGRTTTKRYEGTSTLMADAITRSASLLGDLLALSDIGSLKITYSQDEISSSAAATGANLDAGMTLHCRLDNGKMYPLKVPVPDATVINADGSIDISNTLVTDFVANFMLAGYFRVSEGNYVVSVVSGELDR